MPIHVNGHVTDGACWRGGKCQTAKRNKAASNLPRRLLSHFPLSFNMRSDIQVAFNTMFFQLTTIRCAGSVWGRKKLKMHPSNATKTTPKIHFTVSLNMAFMRGFLCDQQLLLCKASKHLILEHRHTAPTVLHQKNYRHLQVYAHIYCYNQGLNRWQKVA